MKYQVSETDFSFKLNSVCAICCWNDDAYTKQNKRQSKQLICIIFFLQKLSLDSSFLPEAFAEIGFLFKKGEITTTVSDFLILLNFKGRSLCNFEVSLDTQ